VRAAAAAWVGRSWGQGGFVERSLCTCSALGRETAWRPSAEQS
jgi:hypothetical protein